LEAYWATDIDLVNQKTHIVSKFELIIELKLVFEIVLTSHAFIVIDDNLRKKSRLITVTLKMKWFL
jgi:hypothetical protein